MPMLINTRANLITRRLSTRAYIHAMVPRIESSAKGHCPNPSDPRIDKVFLMLPAPHLATKNHLLASLPQAVYLRLAPALELVDLPLGFSIYEAGIQQTHVYFPTDSVVAIVHVMASGITTEVAVTGNDGMVGIPLIMGGDSTSNRAVVRNAGHAYRLKLAVMRSELATNRPLQNLLLRYTQALMTQIAQNTVCARHHTVEQRVARWLLMSFDLMPSDQLMTTHAQIANMLGMHREVITAAIGNLQKSGLIGGKRGWITTSDRSKLEHRACECYAAVKRETNRLIRPNRILSAPSNRPMQAPARQLIHM